MVAPPAGSGGLPRQVEAGLARLTVRWSLSEVQRWQLARLLTSLAVDPHAPSTVRAPAEALDVHVADSLAALELAPLRSARVIADVGSGAGFPGLPLAIALPNARVQLVESAQRKCAFLQRASEQSGVSNAEVVCRRVEEWAEGLGAHDLVVTRALAPSAAVVEYAAPLLALGGALVEWRGRRVAVEERAARAAAEIVGLELAEVRLVAPYEGARNHHLYLYLKVRATPETFPRRTGMARKRPLAG